MRYLILTATTGMTQTFKMPAGGPAGKKKRRYRYKKNTNDTASYARVPDAGGDSNERRTQAVNKELEISASVSFVGELHQKTRKILQFHKFII